MRTVRDIPVLEHIPVFVRAALNVPIENGRVTNSYRLRRALPTISYLCERGAKVILGSHIGDKGTETLEPIAQILSTLIPHVSFVGESIGEKARAAIRALSPGSVLVLENLRRHAGEAKNDRTFARELATLADVFVQDSFDTCHRVHASIVSLPTLLPSYAGLLLEEEVRELSRAEHPKRPALAVIGGSKFSTKETLINRLLESYDYVFVGGALANDFLKGAGHPVGKSLVSPFKESAIRKLLVNSRLVIPIDSVVVPYEALGKPNIYAQARVASLHDVGPDEVILDHGPQTVTLLTNLAEKAETILWNGPLGNYETGFIDATNAFAKAVADSKAQTIVGGGDTIAAIENMSLLSKLSFVSSGGGAMLDFLAKGTLPGIEALERN
jgi:phosphoglycerate kinase